MQLAQGDGGLDQVVLQIGRAAFRASLMDYVDRLAGVDHCMVFAFQADARVDCLLAEGRIERAMAEDLGANYACRFHEGDPNKAAIFANAPGEPIFLPFARRTAYSQAYRKLFFERSHIVDKAAHALWRGSTCYYVNFYRLDRSGPFEPEAARRLARAGATIAASVARHFEIGLVEPRDAGRFPESIEALADIGPLARLTPREKAVCAGILLGHSSQAIADLLSISVNSVLTYRRRAYATLGIASQGQLFSLALRSIAAGRFGAA